MKYKILIYGAKSKGLVVLKMIKDKEVFYNKKKTKDQKVIFFADPTIDKPEFNTSIFFVNKKNQFNKLIKKTNSFLLAIGGGNGFPRYQIAKKLLSKKLKPLSLISSYCYIDKTSSIGSGVQIMPGAVIHCFTKIGDFSIINTSATIDHDCQIGKGVTIMGGTTVAGKVIIEDFASIGANATILPNIKISKGAFIGAGAVVTKNVKENEVVIGNPARFLKKLKTKANLTLF